MRNQVFPEVFFENTVFFFFFCSISISDTFVDGLVGLVVWAYICLLHSIPLLHSLLSQRLVTMVLQCDLRSGFVMPPRWLFLKRTALTIWGLLYFIFIFGLFFLFL